MNLKNLIQLTNKIYSEIFVQIDNSQINVLLCGANDNTEQNLRNRINENGKRNSHRLVSLGRHAKCDVELKLKSHINENGKRNSFNGQAQR